MKQLSVAEVVEVPIDSIVIGQRRRQKLGRVQLLAKSIAARGLIHPLLLRGNDLVAGRRRLEACRQLGWRKVPARQVDRMTDDELRALELEENTQREALTDFEADKARLAQIRQAEVDAKREAAEGITDTGRIKNSSGRGRPKGRTPGSQRDVTARTGVSQPEQARIERHVALAEAYPFMRGTDWGRTNVLDAGDYLEQLPAAERVPIAALLDQPGIPPEKAIPCLKHAAEMESDARSRIIELAEHDDEFERRRALTMLAQTPPLPDPALNPLEEMIRLGRQAAKLCRIPVFKSRIADVAKQAADLHREFAAADRKTRINGETVC